MIGNRIGFNWIVSATACLLFLFFYASCSEGTVNICPSGEELDESGKCVPIEEEPDPPDPNGNENLCDDIQCPPDHYCDSSTGRCVPENTNGNGNGEETDPWQDRSGDGIPDYLDNCPDHYNPDQADRSGDGVGDVCDNCPDHYNPDQTDSTGDGVGDACSPEPAGDLCGSITAEFQVISPNIYIHVDESGSMSRDDGTGLSRLVRVQQGLEEMANRIAGEVRMGIGGFRGSCGGSGVREILPLGQHTSGEVIASLSQLVASGGTPMHDAVRDIYMNSRLQDASDPLNDQRTKVYILIGDGEPNQCSCSTGSQAGENCAQAVAREIGYLYTEHGIQTFIVGFAFNTDVYNMFAEAGRTDNPTDPANRYYMADDGVTLANVIQDITGQYVSCSYSIDPPAPSPGQIWVKIAGNLLPRSEYVYNSEQALLTLSDDACNTLNSLDANIPNALEIIIGCPICLPPGEECPPEWCGEGWTPHPDCDCIPYGSPCNSTDECCEPLDCDEGICGFPCHPPGAICRYDEDCCVGICVVPDGEDRGICVYSPG